MTPDPTTQTASVGDGRYTLTERIATGGMGVVWRANDSVLGRDVAVKILKAEYADDATFRARLQAEARNTAGLHHPGIAQVFDYGDAVDPASGRPTAYLVMELVPGKPLSALLAGDRTLKPEAAADVVAQAAAAIEVAHQQGIVHRDVKPANLIVTPDGAVKVTDFGIARAADAVPLTQTGQVIGTPHYLAPEQARGLPATPASDIYALGVVLYECLSGSRPFTADAPVAVAMQHLREDVPPLPDTVPAGLAALCLRCLAKEPEERVGSAADLAQRLREPGWSSPLPSAGDAEAPGATATVPAGAGATGAAAAGEAAGTRGSHTALLTSPGGAPPAHSDRRRRRRPGWLVPLLAAVAVLVLLTGIGLALTTGDDNHPTAGSGGGAGGGPARDAAPSQSQGIRVDPSDYQGRPYADAAADLRGQGFEVDRADKVGAEGEPGTVDYVLPHGTLEPGTSITLGVWTEPAAQSGGSTAGPGQGNAEPAQPKGGSEKPPKESKSNGKAKGHDKPSGKDKKGGGLLDLPGSG
jgi:eukaryotic-like serine/threonine-protein kinase